MLRHSGARDPGRPQTEVCVPVALLIVAAALSSGCAEATGPSSGGPGITVVAGAAQTDTAFAELSQALVVEVRGSDGQPAVAELVRFASLGTDSAPNASSVLVGAMSAANYGMLVAESTDAQGEAAAVLRLGGTAGRGHVSVSVPRFGYLDTVSFTILPGKAAGLAVAPRDTAVYVGHSYSLRAYVTDAHGNRRTDSVAYAALDSGVAAAPNGLIAGVALGRSSVLVSAVGSQVVDTVQESVVPQGVMAAVVWSGGFSSLPADAVVTMNLDGSGLAVIPQSLQDNYLQWSPAGTGLLLFTTSGGSGGHIYTMSLSGSLTRLIPAGFAEENWGRYAAGGSYIYFRGARSYPGDGYIWRVHPDGSGLDSVPVGSGTQPAPSPDGTRVAWVDGAGTLHIYDYGATRDTSLGVAGWAPHWSPDGAWVAFDQGQGGPISVMKPDGSALRILAGGRSFYWAFDWSPDSRWLIAASGGLLNLIDVQTGLVLPLPFTAYLLEPAWRP